MSKRSDFLKLKKRIENCRICKEDFRFEPRPLVWGNFDAKICQISQAPSLTAYRIQRPFCDKSGEKLRKEWYQIPDKIFYDQSIFCITAISHCYPGKSKSGDKNPPLICARTWLQKELELLNPELFIVIGNYAARFLFPKQNFTSLAFKDLTLKGKPCFILPHPSPQNIKWFKDHPDFEQKRLPKVRKKIKKIIEPSV